MSSTTNHSIKENFVQGLIPRSKNGVNSLLPLSQVATKALPDLEFPGKKWEEWRYTSIKPLVTKNYLPGESFSVGSIDPYLIPGLEADIYVFLNGVYAPELSRITYNENLLQVIPIHELSGENLETFKEYAGSLIGVEDNIFTAINSLYIHNGICIISAKNSEGKAPIHLLHLSTSNSGVETSIQHRNLFLAERGSHFQVVETFHSIGEHVTLRNSLSEIFVKENAKLSYLKFQSENTQSSQIDHSTAHLERDSNFSIHTISFGGKVIRNNLKVILDGPNGNAHLMGLYLLDGVQHVDNHTKVDHAKPHCYSNELYKGIMADQATGVFNGRIHVFQDAQKTNAFQSNRNILLSDTSNMFTKPQLEIYADDVKCSHGATTGKLDSDAMFYLRARGLNEIQAKKLLIQAFATEVTDSLEIEAAQTYLAQLIEERF